MFKPTILSKIKGFDFYDNLEDESIHLNALTDGGTAYFTCSEKISEILDSWSFNSAFKKAFKIYKKERHNKILDKNGKKRKRYSLYVTYRDKYIRG